MLYWLPLFSSLLSVSAANGIVVYQLPKRKVTGDKSILFCLKRSSLRVDNLCWMGYLRRWEDGILSHSKIHMWRDEQQVIKCGNNEGCVEVSAYRVYFTWTYRRSRTMLWVGWRVGEGGRTHFILRPICNGGMLTLGKSESQNVSVIPLVRFFCSLLCFYILSLFIL